MALRSSIRAGRKLLSLASGSARGIQTSAAVAGNAAELVKNVPNQLLIDGKFVPAASGKQFAVIDPRNEEAIFNMAEGDAADVDRAVRAARKAFDEGPWPKMTAKERSRILMRFADLLEKHADELAALEALDNGKPLYMAKLADVPLTVDHFRYYAGWSDKIHGKTIPADGPYFTYTLHEPIGVVGQIIPWNFPLLMLAWKVAPALACGNTVVLKPAEQTPLTAMRAGQLALEAGLPPGVLNIVPGFGSAGAALAKHPLLDKVAFTGSTEVGRKVAHAAAEGIKPVTLELGGKSPIIVWKDVNVDQAVADAHFALFFNHGQCCAAGSRLYVHEAVYDEFVEKAAASAKARKVGDPFAPGVEQGPQVDADQLQKILGYIDLGNREGARLVAGGARHGDKGYFVQPTVFADAHDGMSIAKEEIFGPVQTIMKYKTLDEAIKRANSNEYGLAAGVFAKDIDVINTATRALRAGTVWTNCYNVFDSAVPFGGYKMSGVGRDKGQYALEHYTKVKAVYQKLAPGQAWM